MLFDGWGGIVRVLLVGTLACGALVVVLRATGKRALSKMNAFDLVVTVALGSALASTILSKNTPLAEGLAGLCLLVLLQFGVTWLSVRSPRFESLVKAQPRLLVHRGRFMRGAMRRERVSEEEVLAALRGSGSGDLDETMSVVLETDGTLSVVRGSETGAAATSLAPVAGKDG